MPATATPDLDRDVPALLVRIGRYPLHHGGVGAIRTLGRLGVPVYAITEDRLTPAAVSRYLTGRLVWPTSGAEDPAALAAGLREVCHRLDRPAVAIPTDDEAAVLLAEYADELREHLLLPRVAPALPAALADKRGLHGLCREHGVATPATEFPYSTEDLHGAVERIGFPVVVKNVAPWVRLRAPAVGGSTLVRTWSELAPLARSWPPAARFLVQEYVPAGESRDWITQVHVGADGEPLAMTGLKLRCWPPRAGTMTYGRAVANPPLARLALEFCRGVGFRGAADLDWRFDRRDGRYKLVDFNPRVGAQFRLFETDAGIDVVRALHLDLTGRQVPAGRQIEERRLVVENLDAAAVLAARPRRGAPPPPALPPPTALAATAPSATAPSATAPSATAPSATAPSATPPRGRIEPAWFAPDDPAPFAVMLVRFMWLVLLRMARRAPSA